MLCHFVGSFDRRQQLPAGPVESLLQATASSHDWTVSTSGSGRLQIAGNCVVSLAGPPEWPQATANTAAVAGSLLLEPTLGTARSSREALRTVVARLETGDHSILAHANGTFAAAFYSAQRDELILCTDSLGARPLYFREDKSRVWFATSFALLTSVANLSNSINLQAVAEQFAFCYPLRERTIALEISVLRDGEMLVAGSDGVRLIRYSDWKDYPVAKRDLEEELDVCAQAFRSSVEDRLAESGDQYSLLSGGLDSRLIVATILEKGRSVKAATASSLGGQDYFYAHQFAKAVDVPLIDVDKPIVVETTPGKRTARLLSAASAPFRGHAVFSGDGGGETLGFLMMSPGIISLLQEKRTEEVLRKYSSESPLPLSILSSSTVRTIRDAPYLGMQQEFSELADLEPAKAFQLFLLRNDLRRHLHDYFNSLDDHTCELLLPFYDRRVLGSVLRIAPPLQDYIRHAFYYRLLDRLSPSIQAVSWQAYPKSLPCPLPGASSVPDQWDLAVDQFARASSRWRSTSVRALLAGRPIRADIVMPSRIAGAALLDMLKVRKYGYLFMSHLAIEDIYRSLQKADS